MSEYLGFYTAVMSLISPNEGSGNFREITRTNIPKGNEHDLESFITQMKQRRITFQQFIEQDVDAFRKSLVDWSGDENYCTTTPGKEMVSAFEKLKEAIPEARELQLEMFVAEITRIVGPVKAQEMGNALGKTMKEKKAGSFSELEPVDPWYCAIAVFGSEDKELLNDILAAFNETREKTKGEAFKAGSKKTDTEIKELMAFTNTNWRKHRKNEITQKDSSIIKKEKQSTGK